MFSKKEEIERPNVQIIYSIDESLDTTIDVVLEDYEQETLIQLFAMLDVLASEATYLETVQMIGENLQKNGKEKELYQLINHVTTQQTLRAAKQLGNSDQEEKPKEKPCIRPSDML